MNIWKRLENIAEMGLPFLAFLLKDRAGESGLFSEYDTQHVELARLANRELFELLEKEPEAKRFLHLRKMCGETGAMVLDCAMSCALYPHLEGMLAECVEGGCSFSIAKELDAKSTYDEMWQQYRNIKQLLPVKNPDETMFFRKKFYVDQRLLNYLAGVDELPGDLETYASLWNPSEVLQPMYVDTERIPALQKLVQTGNLLQLAGDNGRGKRLLLRHTLAALDRWGICVDGTVLCRQKNVRTLLWEIRREALLLHAVVCVYGINEEWERQNDHSFLATLREYFQNVGLCVCTTSGINLTSGQNGDWNRVELLGLTQEDYISVWAGYCTQLDISMDPKVLGSRYRLSPDQIAKAARRISEAGEPTPQVLLQACIDVLPAAGNSVKQMHVTYTFDDLKVTPQTRAVLDSICSHVNHREQVYGQWNLESRYAYGKCVSALFSGPPGTGKTMAAHVISSELSIPLYSVNLSQIVDKYIGETEKKLEQVFDIAERSNIILFFDEADSLFGKRSEVNDSKDRYANIEVSYILQRLEQYDGIVILATNHRNNIDEAFMRRIRYAASFPLPDEHLRKEIWKGCFSKQTPVLDIDYDFLAKAFEFSGGDIKNVALNAAFLAAQESGNGIGLIHVLKSIQMEYVKTNRILLREDLQEYAWMFELIKHD